MSFEAMINRRAGCAAFPISGRRTSRSASSPPRDGARLAARGAGAKGTKEGCGEGDCGACTVVLARLRDGRLIYEAVNACMLLLGQVDGAELITVEDLAEGGELHPVQQAMVDNMARNAASARRAS